MSIKTYKQATLDAMVEEMLYSLRKAWDELHK